MAKIDANQKNIMQVLTENKNFVIPDYQRPYAWDEEKCETLFNDFLDFTFPNKDPENFNENSDEYYLGSIVVGIIAKIRHLKSSMVSKD